MQTHHGIPVVTDDTLITVTVDPHGPYPVTLDPAPYGVVADSVGIVGLLRRVGRPKVAAGGWVVRTEGIAGPIDYRLEIA